MKVWVFDVDGVLTDPEKKIVSETKILDKIYQLLKNGDSVALNTGRSLVWTKERILNPLLQVIDDKNALTNFIAVGEKGGAWIFFEENGMEKVIDSNFSIPESLQKSAKNLIKDRYSDIAFYDETKETMISIEMNDGARVEDFAPRQKSINSELEKILHRKNLKRDYKIDPTRISTDIQHKNAGKALGAKRIIKFIKDKKLDPSLFVCFGDSRSDLEMAFEFQNNRLNVEMVYVGEKQTLEGIETDFPVIFTDHKCDKGTLEYLQKINRV